MQPRQLEFSWIQSEPDAVRLQRELEQRTGLRLRLIVTDNRSSLLTFRRAARGRPADLRVHHMFLDAEPAVVGALAEWIRRPRDPEAGGTIDRYIRANGHLIRQAAASSTRIRTQGEHHDLQAYFDEVNRKEFGGRIDARITWGRHGSGGRRRSIRFGSYWEQQNLIRIHPALDQEFVPAFFVRYIVFHEMLHAAMGVSRGKNGRRRVHPPEFLRRERTYPDYARAIAWQEQPGNLRRLLKWRRK